MPIAKKSARTSAKQSAKQSKPALPADAVDEQLARYRSMRDFTVTAEPSGDKRAKPKSTLPFCIQKHAASHLHYDFRLGWNGVLKSWACAKGPSYVVADKRLAVQVEDHPIEYGGFEGIIPAGQYGGGTVMLWDQGTWEPQPGHTDVDAGLAAGSLKFILYGEKMRGKWALIRMGGKAATERKPNWLLIKEHDDFERHASAPAITEEQPNSVITDRSLEQIAASEDHVWNSKDTAGKAQAWFRQSGKPKPGKTDNDTRNGAGSRLSGSNNAGNSGAGSSGVENDTRENLSSRPKRSAAERPASRTTSTPKTPLHSPGKPTLTKLPTETQPTFIKPQLATEAAKPPSGPGWLHELKLDGYRIQARKAGDRVQLLTRSGLDWTARMASIAAAVRSLPDHAVTLDGEVVVVSPNGTTSFADLQAAFQDNAQHPLTYFCFDLLHLDGHNTRDLPLLERKALLANVLASADPQTLRLSEHLESSGEPIFQRACALHAEGIVSKRAQSRYTSARTSDWLKLKCLHEQEFVIGGFTLPSNGTRGIGALLLGYYLEGQLIYAGRTGTGFTQKTHRSLRDILDKLTTKQNPFAAIPAVARRGVTWVTPTLVAQVRFATWTAENQLRQAAFLGLREDKPAKEVAREEAAPTPKRSKSVSVEEPMRQSRHKSASTASAPSRNKAASIEGAGLQSRHRTQPSKRGFSPGGKPSAVDQPQTSPVRLTHPTKVLDAESQTTKQQLADYYWAMAPHMLPHIAGRPLSLVRCPDGAGKPCFYQKHVTPMLPKGIATVMVADKKSARPEPYITLSTREALSGLAQISVLELHPWGSHNETLDFADRLVFDLDPDESLPWSAVTAAALDVRARLKKLKLESFVKTTGGKGLHVVVPIQPEHDWTAIKTFAHRFVLAMEEENPARYLSKMTKSARAGRIFLDYLRNERGSTSVAPYSPRARAGCPVSMPLAWSELAAKDRPRFHVSNISTWRTRLARDPWAALLKSKQRLTLPVEPASHSRRQRITRTQSGKNFG